MSKTLPPRGSPAGAANGEWARERRSMSPATTSMRAAKASSSSCGSTSADSLAPATDPAVPSAPKSSPSATRTRCRRACGSNAISEVAPTMSSELVVAV